MTVVFLLLVAYLIPSVIALYRRKVNAGPILVVNILLGWCFVGWVIALAWAVSGKRGS